ncbi:MAG: SDR family oxidoreductase [Moorea sp. SIO3I7]|uniref:NAD(P)-dependent oxidoreductase n=1 Tax=unclassified Moorena TaxID=2683338 RepID=UPI0013BF62F9|nr:MULTISPECIES: SDR family oxidoreductase [unclassified Moorena]NEN97150.1 SDR family oxidoreductase [Moorena sp. SIO3I7]NEO04694.1 SDR family oxidoreductase [Moorena sp. SIO3I8]NEP24750.1 SDR family oxidoreductase [Moorena sp. SIO3I6]
MNILIFGSTGGTGRQVVEQALEQGHRVTAFARNPAKLDINHANLKVVQGDVMDVTSVEKAVQGQEAVVCVLGAGQKMTGTIRSEGTQQIIHAMEKAGIRRFICQSTLGAGDSWENLNFFWKYIMFGFLLRHVFADHQRQENYVQQSSLDWTIVRPGAFVDGNRTGKYRHGFPSNDKTSKLKISRADVADFILKQLADEKYIHKTPSLSY